MSEAMKPLVNAARKGDKAALKAWMEDGGDINGLLDDVSVRRARNRAARAAQGRLARQTRARVAQSRRHRARAPTAPPRTAHPHVPPHVRRM